MMRNGLRKFGVAERQQRELFQLAGKEKEPKAARSQRRGKVPQVRPGSGRKFRPGHPEEIDEAHKNEPKGDPRKKLGVAFQVAREQQKERHEKVKNDDDEGHHAPLAVEPRAIEGDLLGLVAGPNDEQLGKVEIGPKHYKRQRKLAQIVNVAALQNAPQGPR